MLLRRTLLASAALLVAAFAEEDVIDGFPVGYEAEEAEEGIDDVEEPLEGELVGDDGELLDEDEPLTPLPIAVIHEVHIRIDVNHNGKVSMAEIMNFHDKMRKQRAKEDIGSYLQKVDEDKDGKLSLSEVLEQDEEDAMEAAEEDEEEEGMTRSKEDKLEEESWINMEKLKFKAADSNDDGFLQGEEVSAFYWPDTHPGVLDATTRAVLEQRDKNGDGKLDAKEFWDGEGDPGTIEGADGIDEEERLEFEKLDSNKDGFLDVEELKAWESGRYRAEEAFKELFNVSDADGDKHVTKEELVKTREQIAGLEAQDHLEDWGKDEL